MPITDQQVLLRRQLADNLRADSDAIQDHLRLVKMLVSDSGTGALWTDTYVFPIRDIEITIDEGAGMHPEAHRFLVNALELKIQAALPQLCRDVLADAAARAEVAIARFTTTAPPEDATAISKVLGSPAPASSAD
jgi:hypothetical protein